MIKQRNYIFMLIVLMAAGAVAWECYFLEFQWHGAPPTAILPARAGKWVSQQLPIKKTDISLLEADHAYIRRYTGPHKQEVYLNIAYSQTNKTIVPPPEVFYSEENISILDKSRELIILKSFGKPVQLWTSRLVLDNDTVRQVALYWFKIGNVDTPSYWRHRLLVALNTLRGRRTGSAVICISSDIIEGNQDKAVKAIKDFATVIIPQLSVYLP